MKLAVSVGIAAGAAFFLHAMLPNSHTWPLIWPIAGGVLVQILASRRHKWSGFGDGLRLAGTTGIVAGAFFFIATVGALYTLGADQMAVVAQALGGSGPIPLTAVTVKAVGVAAVAGILLVILGGGLAFPIARHVARAK
jgi:hypothetical protein